MGKLHTRSCATQMIMKSLHFCPGCDVFSCQVWNLCLFVTEEANSLFTTETIPQCTSETGGCLLKLKAQRVDVRSLLFLIMHDLCNCIWQSSDYYFSLFLVEYLPSLFLLKIKIINYFMFLVSVAGPPLIRVYCSSIKYFGLDLHVCWRENTNL